MPFVTQDHRKDPDMAIPGDICYTYYHEMVRQWKNEPRWTTAHKIYKEMTDSLRHAHVSENFRDGCDQCAGCQLAWQVFFIKYVMPYEDKKEAENGTI